MFEVQVAAVIFLSLLCYHFVLLLREVRSQDPRTEVACPIRSLKEKDVPKI